MIWVSRDLKFFADFQNPEAWDDVVTWEPDYDGQTREFRKLTEKMWDAIKDGSHPNLTALRKIVDNNNVFGK